MGSRVMHFAISTRILREINLADESFILGGMAPDVCKNMNAAKSASHFIKIDGNGLAFVDLEGFRAKYLSSAANPFLLGYYSHLISDQIWVDEIYMKKIKWLPQPQKKKAQAQYYRDFWKLNGKLIQHYKLSLPIQPIEQQVSAMDEIQVDLLPELWKDLLFDFDHRHDAMNEPLELLDWQEVVDLLELTVSTCLSDMKEKRYI
ncbi:hypothetical protein D3P07_08740 [Paenibacillus sp. 1011MAR3C5]|uniref:zinc dependent phospholipase C family protein n=1 Tax=Paenibacillus sp. 1011MAR3C5 TaxID=1675787 RepID=UPI000E6BF618|nr:zinc dependent phospholipase C family protein [Paenibacillus sp. 1011MAR3C5]RJE90281.1 hypothetical protein D3P07_08740 [Paenibacillus sp. 1011MAR3C5]